MITWLADATTRHRRAILLVGVACATAQAWFTALVPPTSTALLVLLLPALLLMALGAIGSWQTFPAAFAVRRDLVAFTAPTQPWAVYSTLGWLMCAGYGIGTVARHVRTDDWLWIEALAVGAYAVAIGFHVTHAWRGYGLYLRSDGLYDQRVLGTLMVPWDALRSAQPQVRRGRSTTIVIPPGPYAAHDTSPARERPGEVRLDYARPDLTRRRGLAGTTKRLDTHVDTGFLAAAISFYARHPEHRTGIGTDDGYRRLQQVLAEGPQ
jgi:hypothetical protein